MRITESFRRTSPGRLDSVIPELDPGLVHVRTGTLKLASVDLDFVSQFLSADEWDRVNNFRFPMHQDRFIAGRGLLRLLLSNYLNFPPGQLTFGCTEKGKPFLLEPHRDAVQFNVSHSEDNIAVAISRAPVGIDIELLREIQEMDSLAKHVFSPVELRDWATIPEADRPESFLALWTRKEALLKAIGDGIADHLREVSVFFDDQRAVFLPPPLNDFPWTVRSLRLGKNVVGAVALRGEFARVETVPLKLSDLVASGSAFAD